MPTQWSPFSQNINLTNVIFWWIIFPIFPTMPDLELNGMESKSGSSSSFESSFESILSSLRRCFEKNQTLLFGRTLPCLHLEMLFEHRVCLNNSMTSGHSRNKGFTIFDINLSAADLQLRIISLVFDELSFCSESKPEYASTNACSLVFKI